MVIIIVRSPIVRSQVVRRSKSNYFKICFFVLFFLTMDYGLLTMDCLYASFDTTYGIKNSAIAKSGVTALNDVSSMMLNPAGLAYVKGSEFLFEYQKLYLGTSRPEVDIPGYYNVDVSKGDFAVGFPLPKNIGGFGFYYTELNGTGLYRENTYSFCYARTLEEIFLKEKEEEFSYGFALKYLTLTYIKDEYTNDFFEKYGDESSGFASDVCIMYSPVRDLDFGLSLLNVMSSDLGLRYENKPEKMMFFGLAYRLNNGLKLSSAYSQKDSYPNNNFHFGMQTMPFFDTLTLRAGANRNEGSFGFSFDFKGLGGFYKIDYVFSMPLEMKDNNGSHGMALSFEIPPLIKSEIVEEKPQIPEIVADALASEIPEEKPELKPVEVPKKIDVKETMRKHYNKAIWHLKRNEDELAIKEFEEILKYDPNHKPSLVRIKEAKKRVEDKWKKKNMRLHWRKGVEFFQQKKYQEAKKEFEEILKFDPNHKPSLQRLELIKKK